MRCRVTNDQPSPRVLYDVKRRPATILPGKSAVIDLDEETYETQRALALVKKGPQVEIVEDKPAPEVRHVAVTDPMPEPEPQPEPQPAPEPEPEPEPEDSGEDVLGETPPAYEPPPLPKRKYKPRKPRKARRPRISSEESING